MLRSETFNMDCLDYLKTCKDKQFSCGMLDPPYGAAINADWSTKKTGRFGGEFKKYFEGLSVENNVDHVDHGSGGRFKRYETEVKTPHWDVAPPDIFWEEIFRVCDHLFVWGGNYFMLPPSRNWVVWEKLTISETFSMSMAELCWTSIPGNIKVIKCAPQGKYRFHATQKPRLLYDKILEWYGDKYCKEKGIIDPFLGSGSSRISSWDAGIDFVGIELNTYYFKNQEIRFKEHVAKGNLYEKNNLEIAEYGEGLY